MNIIPLHSAPRSSLRIRQLQHTRRETESKKIAFSTREGLYIMSVTSIVYCSAMDNYCQVFRNEGNPVTVAKTLKAVDACLCAHGFIRVHQSQLVAINAIVFVGHDHVLLSNGKELPMSRARRSMVLEYVMKYVQLV